MTLLNIIVNNKIATYQKRGGDIVCGNSDYQINFTFDDEWSAYAEKTARFIWNGAYFDVPFTGNTCQAPIITNATKVLVGVYAGDLCTTTSAVIGCQPSILCGTQTRYLEANQDFAKEAQDAANEAKGYADDAKRAADRAEEELETKLDKTSYPDYMRVYGTHPDGRQGMFLVSPSVLSAGGAIIMRDIHGNAEIGDPTKAAHIVNKKYVDALAEKSLSFSNGDIVNVEDNTFYRADSEISSLNIVYPNGDFSCAFSFTLASSGNITITLPESKYIGGIPSFNNGETWELNIKNGVVVGGLVE